MKVSRPRFLLACVLLLGGATLGVRALIRSRRVQLLGRLVFRVPTDKPLVALTFDDGPTPGVADALLATLNAHHAHATFFINGNALAHAPSIGQSLVAAGDELGNHTYSHRSMLLVAPRDMRAEIERTDSLIRLTGQQGVIYFRPPYSHKFIGLPYFLWRTHRITITQDIEPETYLSASATPAEIVGFVMSRVHAGSIILLHVWYPTRRSSLDAVPLLLDSLAARGYCVVAVSTLIAAAASGGSGITCVAPAGRSLEARFARILFDSPAGELGR